MAYSKEWVYNGPIGQVLVRLVRVLNTEPKLFPVVGRFRVLGNKEVRPSVGLFLEPPGPPMDLAQVFFLFVGYNQEALDIFRIRNVVLSQLVRAVFEHRSPLPTSELERYEREKGYYRNITMIGQYLRRGVGNANDSSSAIQNINFAALAMVTKFIIKLLESLYFSRLPFRRDEDKVVVVFHQKTLDTFHVPLDTSSCVPFIIGIEHNNVNVLAGMLDSIGVPNALRDSMIDSVQGAPEATEDAAVDSKILETLDRRSCNSRKFALGKIWHRRGGSKLRGALAVQSLFILLSNSVT
jgi:hypothetical protein